VDVVVYGGPPSHLRGESLEAAVDALVARLLRAELVLTDLAVVDDSTPGNFLFNITALHISPSPQLSLSLFFSFSHRHTLPP
jgi:hypothetical protein